MSRAGFFLIVLFLSKPLLVSGQESERRRVIGAEELWPAFDVARQSKGIQIGLQGLWKIEADSAARVELATALLNSIMEAGDLNAAGGWLKEEPSIKQSCTAWAKLALMGAREKDLQSWNRARAEAERLAPISSLREGRAAWLYLYEGALVVGSDKAQHYFKKFPSEDFESQSDLKGLRIRRIGEGLDTKMDEKHLNALLAPPPTQASLDLMAYALRLVEVLRGGACQKGNVPFSAVASQAMKCALESAANPAPILVSILAEAGRCGVQEAITDDCFEQATQFLAISNLDEEKPSYLLEMAKVAEMRGDRDHQKQFLRASEQSLLRLEPALQPEGLMRIGQTYVRQSEWAQAWQIWGKLLDQLEHNPNRDLWFLMSCKIALEIDSWTGEMADLKASALAELEARVGGAN
jgi:hypothetical protein